MIPTGEFTRSKSGGVFKVKGSAGGNMYPPSPIRDLQVYNVLPNLDFYLSFTFPGADLNSGIINSFSVFYGNNRSDVENLEPASTVPKITADMLTCTDCSLDPLPPSTKLELQLSRSFFDQDTEYYFRVMAMDEAGNNMKTSTSNVVVFAPNLNLYPPSDIGDLTLFQENGTFLAFYLSFTFPGADFSTGTIDSFIIFFAQNLTDIDNLTPSSNVSSITEEMLDCNCVLEPQPPLTPMMLRINSSYFQSETEYFFRVLAIDQPGNNFKTSDSNAAVITLNSAPEEEEVFCMNIWLQNFILFYRRRLVQEAQD